MRRADLGVGHRAFHQLRDAQVAEFHHLAGHAKHVRRLDVAVQDLLRVKRLETARNLDEVAPDEVLGKELALRLALAQGAGEIAEGGVLHHDAQTVAVDERLVEAADGGVLLYRREQANLIHSLLALLLREVAHVGLLQRVHLVVAQASHAIAARGEDEMNGGGEKARVRDARGDGKGRGLWTGWARRAFFLARVSGGGSPDTPDAIPSRSGVGVRPSGGMPTRNTRAMTSDTSTSPKAIGRDDDGRSRRASRALTDPVSGGAVTGNDRPIARVGAPVRGSRVGRDVH